MMKFLADENLDAPIVKELRANGFDVLFILESHSGIDDEDVLSIAKSQDRLLITQDKDFGELVFRLNQIHAGVILVRLGGISPSQKASIVTYTVLTHLNELANAFTVIQEKSIRIRKSK